jgi:CHAT domain-containing protein/tetratricopeptide (TPR) repeat protein
MFRLHACNLALALWIFVPPLLWAAQAQSGPTPQVLEPLKSVDRSLLPGEKHTYNLNLLSGQYVHILIEQAGVDLAARLLDASGGTVVEVENATREEEALPLSFIALANGVYRLEISLRRETAAQGRYRVSVGELHSSRPEDEKRIAAEKAYSEAERRRAQGSEESLHQALVAYETALPLWRDLDSPREIANTLNSIGEVYFVLGEVKKSLEYREQALPLRRDLDDRRGVASALNSIAVSYAYLGELQKGVEYYNQALQLFREQSDRRAEAATLNNIGVAYRRLGEDKEALDNFAEALALLGSAEDPRLQAVVLNSIGVTYSIQGTSQKALEYFNSALPLRRSTGDRRGEGITIFNIGLEYSRLRQPGRALEYYDQALSIARDVGDRRFEARVLNRLGLAYLDSGDPQKAFEALNQGVPMARASGEREAEVFGLSYLARVERATGNLDKARATIEAAIELMEDTRSSIAGQDLRTSFFATVRRLYDSLIDVLMQLHQQRPGQGYDAEALQASERARARSLLDLLNEEHVDIRQDVDPALLEQERSVQASLNLKTERQMRLLGGKHTEEQAAAINKELQGLVTEYRKVQAEIRTGSPHYAALTQPQTVTLAEIQKQLLDPDTLLLEYALGEDRSFVWTVTADSLTTHVLPNRAEIEAAARRVYERLTSNAGRDKETLDEIGGLSRMLLGPLAGQLERKRLVVVAEGALQYIPFAALVTPSSSRQPLIVEHEIVNLPSVSTLAVLRREMKGRPLAPKLLAVVADPVFDREDPRVLGSRSPAVVMSAPDNLARSAKEAGVFRFDRLYSSRQEAEAIGALAPKGKKLQALDFDASRNTATSAELAQYRIVHFATHGLLNSQHPELSGLVLSLVDAEGKPQNGFLQAHEIYNLTFGAELVVLSACQTALGKEIRGEGLLGLTRGFMYAGAPRVVASLWNVPDRGTAELMKRFYQSMLAKGLPPAAALRGAQLAMWQDKRWSSPFYWAGFTLQGEWR